MKKPDGKNENIFFPAKLTLYLLIIAVPLAVTTITHNQSDLPKNFVLIITASIFCLLIAGGLCISYFQTGKKSKETTFSFLPSLDIPVLLLLLAAVLSALFSINSYVSYYGQYDRQIGLVTYIYLFILYFFSSILLEKEDFSLKLVLWMEITAVLVAFYAILQQLGVDPLSVQPVSDTRPVTTIGNAVFAGGFLAMVLPLSVFNISDKKNKFLIYLFPAVILAGIVVTRTRSAYLAVIAELIVAAVILFSAFRKGKEGKRNNRKIIYFTAAGIAAIVILILAFPGNIFTERFLSIFGGESNPRWMIWRDALGILGKYPLTGPGIGTFPNAFAEFYSYELRYQDVNRYVDNAHNNYLQILFTMGAIGLLSYLTVLFSVFRSCYKNIFKEDSTGNNGNSRQFFTAIFTSFAGYSVYGLTNFDELTIMLYFIMLLVLLRNKLPGKKSIVFKRSVLNKVIIGSAALVISVFVIFTSINVTNILYADIHFLKGEKLVIGNQFKNGIYEMNTAVILQPENPVYRQLLAENVYGFLNMNRSVKESSKMDLLRQAADELIKARKNHPNVNDCDALLSLVYYESGRTAEAEELKNKVLGADAVNVMYRLNLAYCFIAKNDLTSAKEQLTAIDKINFLGMNRWFVEAKYYIAAGNKTDALNACSKILAKEPNNAEVLELEKKANMLP